MTSPRISILTTSYNQADYLEDTIRSVVNQGYANLEYIVIDGGSGDGSIDIIRRYADRITYWVSESDAGQTDALNKALDHATGDIVGFLNSDDLYLPGALHTIGSWFAENAEAEWVCGDTLMFGLEKVSWMCVARPPQSAADAIAGAYRAAQPGMFWRRELLADGFDTTLHYCFDHALYARLLLAGHRCQHLNTPIAAYRHHAASKTVSAPAHFEAEFDAVAEKFSNALGLIARRRCESVLHLRKAAGIAGGSSNTSDRLRELTSAALKYPPVLATRAFWGSTKRAIRLST